MDHLIVTISNSLTFIRGLDSQRQGYTEASFIIFYKKTESFFFLDNRESDSVLQTGIEQLRGRSKSVDGLTIMKQLVRAVTLVQAGELIPGTTWASLQTVSRNKGTQGIS